MRPRAVFSAANWVPTFLSGAKVQLFHGFNVEKRDSARGHFRVRGMFDLYCTQGPATTAPFREIAAQQGHFAVAETGWPKLDPLFRDDGGERRAARSRGGRPVILFGSTFTERLSAAPHLHAQIAADIAAGERYWLLTLHPKCPPDLFERYRALAGAHARFIEPEQVMAAQRAADVLVSDTSSIVSEFIVQHKPVVTFRNRVPKPHMIDFDDPLQLPAMLQRALHPDAALQAEIVRYADAIHPYRDGLSSERVIAATEDFLSGEMGALRRKPFGSWVRDLQIRKDLGYWGRRSADGLMRIHAMRGCTTPLAVGPAAGRQPRQCLRLPASGRHCLYCLPAQRAPRQRCGQLLHHLVRLRPRQVVQGERHIAMRAGGIQLQAAGTQQLVQR